jgi:hypothetical protein
LSAAVLLPENCTPGVDCQGARVLIVQFPPIPIADGATLYACDVSISAGTAVGNYPLTCLVPSASDPDGKPLPAQCVDGQLQVLPTSTRTVTPTVTPTGTPVPGGGGGGCEIASMQHNHAGLLWFAAAALLRRRRHAPQPTAGDDATA